MTEPAGMKPQRRACYYGDYLMLDRVLSAQAPESARMGRMAHDEMLFIITHQAYELWFKQVLHEMDRIQSDFSETPLDDRSLSRAAKGLERIRDILKFVIGQLDILETMTPLDFLEFRDILFPASGFQSTQFRLIEIRLGLKRDTRVALDEKPYESRLQGADRDAVMLAESQPSLFNQLEAWLSRTPFLTQGDFRFRDAYRKAVVAMLEADLAYLEGPGADADSREADARALEKALTRFQAIFEPDSAPGAWRMAPQAVEGALFITLYRDEPALQTPFRVLSALMDIDEAMTLWRYRHALMVQRMIGVKLGTGGSSGHDYLAATARAHRIFGDLFQLSTYLIPRSALPALPQETARRMGLVYASEGARP